MCVAMSRLKENTKSARKSFSNHGEEDCCQEQGAQAGQGAAAGSGDKDVIDALQNPFLSPAGQLILAARAVSLCDCC